MIPAGELDQLIRIETPTKTTNGVGEEVITWMLDDEVWARVIQKPGREFLEGDLQAEEKAAFKIRFRPMNSEARVIWHGQTYSIDSVTGTFRSGETWLHCTAKSGAS